MITPAATGARPAASTRENRPPASVTAGNVVLAVAVVLVCFWLYLGRPYSVVSDIGYQALSARQYVDHYTPVFNSLRLVDPRDLAKDIVTPLTAWTPSWTALYTVAFKAGLSPGKAARTLALLMSLIGALGWLRIVALVGLRGPWRAGGIVIAALYCLRSGSVSKTGAGDQIIYAVAPWFIAAAAALAVPLAGSIRSRLVAWTMLLCLGLGGVYWLKYSGIFLSIAILGAVVIEQFRSRIRAQTISSLLVLILYGGGFLAPLLGLKAFNYARSGSDFIESSARVGPPRSWARVEGFLSETAYNAGPILFSADSGAARVAGAPQTPRGWLIRLPGFLLLIAFFYLMARQSPGYVRNLTLLSGLVPLAGFPALSFFGGAHFSFAIARCCEPFWILLELQILWLLSRPAASPSLLERKARTALALATAFQLLLFLWIPFDSAREAWKIAHTPAYESSAADLWDTDLSKYGTRDIDDRVRSLLRGPRDIVVPAVYSDRAFATDTMIEFGGRLLPLSPGFVPLVQTHGRDGANYNSTTPFVSSEPLRIVLVAPDPYNRTDFRASTERIMHRFTQVREWAPGPADPHGRVWIWTGEVH